MNYNGMKKAELIAHIHKLETQENRTLQVTSCQIFPFHDGVSLGTVRALASIVISDQLQIRGLRIMDGENGLCVSYPADPFYRGDDFRCICCPITRAVREHIETVVLEHYQRAIGAEASHG